MVVNGRISVITDKKIIKTNSTRLFSETIFLNKIDNSSLEFCEPNNALMELLIKLNISSNPFIILPSSEYSFNETNKISRYAKGDANLNKTFKYLGLVKNTNGNSSSGIFLLSSISVVQPNGFTEEPKGIQPNENTVLPIFFFTIENQGAKKMLNSSTFILFILHSKKKIKFVTMIHTNTSVPSKNEL